MQRRQLLRLAGAGMLSWNVPFALAGQTQRPKVIWVLLRGGMDSLHCVLPLADDDLMRQREGIVAGVADKALPLEQGFALHPAMDNMYKLYGQGELIPIVATGSGAETRSHFRAQDFIECGLPELNHDSGWLNRAVVAHQGEGLAIAHSIPVSLRGDLLAKTWFPDSLPPAEDDLYARLQGLYQDDTLLHDRLMDGLETRDKLGDMKSSKASQRFTSLADSCARLMVQADGPDCAMLEMGGWDTHNNAQFRLNRQFSELDAGIARMKRLLGTQWNNTVVMVASEFGRTVAENGTKGSDHGTGGAMFLAGGAVQGGRVMGDWPGLAKSNQFEGRDLRPTTDVRAWMAATLHQHWQLSESQLQNVFPGISPVDARLIKRV
ncbi:MAG: DUF1501 domain-containing protein [Pseudomonadales bacterium]